MEEACAERLASGFRGFVAIGAAHQCGTGEVWCLETGTDMMDERVTNGGNPIAGLFLDGKSYEHR
jgi:glucose/arabinose dehydrogenase